jgi:hypothetical protein
VSIKASAGQHDCKANLDKDCMCRVCGEANHDLHNDSNHSGTGSVNEWCERCGRHEAFYDDTGYILETTFTDQVPIAGTATPPKPSQQDAQPPAED